MTDGVFGIGYGQTSGIGGGYLPPKKDNDVEEKNNAQEQTAASVQRKDVNPDEVMAFLANQNYFMPVSVEAKPAVKEVGGVDAETEERIAGYMERFEEIYAVVEQEFGAEVAPTVMDLVMDKLMGMA